jgi:hypothetical protein
VHFVGKGSFDGLASIPEALLGHQLIHTFKELGVQGEGDFGFRHPSMMFHHTTGYAVCRRAEWRVHAREASHEGDNEEDSLPAARRAV